MIDVVRIAAHAQAAVSLMAPESAALLIATGFGLGLRHATEPDHVAAVATMTADATSSIAAGRIGVLWGIGHSGSVFAVGIGVLLVGSELPEALIRFFEAVAGTVSVVLAIVGIRRVYAPSIFSGVRESAGAPFADAPRSAWRSMAIGTAHGLAGSGFITLLVLASIARISTGVMYLLMFGAGTTVGMGILAWLFSRSVLAAGRVSDATVGSGRLIRCVLFVSAAMSGAIGARLLADIARA